MSVKNINWYHTERTVFVERSPSKLHIWTLFFFFMLENFPRDEHGIIYHFSKSRYKFSLVLRARFWPVVPQKHSLVVYLCRVIVIGKKTNNFQHSIYCTVGNRHHLCLTLLAWSVSLDLCISGTPHHVGSSTSCLVMQALSMKSPFTRRSL